MNEIERELEFELHRVLDPISRVPIPARRSPVAVTWTRRLMGGTGGALAFKLAAGVVAAAAAATVVTAAATGTLNPTQVSQGISQKVENCKDSLQDGQHGIGQCVSAIAQHHGSSQSGDNTNGHPGNSTGAPHGNANGQSGSTPPGQSKDKDKGKATGQTTSKGK